MAENIERCLCIDIGFINPGIALLIMNKKTKRLNIRVYEDVKFNSVTDSEYILNYFFSQKIDTVILEQQLVSKNIALMQFMHGYSLGKGIKVIIKRPISFLRIKNEGEKVTRSIKKNFSISYLNNTLEKNSIDKRYSSKDSDICDAINLGLSYFYSLNKKNINNVEILIDKILHCKFE